MPTPRLKIATLDETTLDKVRLMEEELGSCIVALEPYLPAANLTEEQLQRLRALEKELGVVLLAYKAD